MVNFIEIENNNLLERKLECPVCLDMLDNPRILTECGHSLCTNCIILIVSRNFDSENLIIECPTCLKKTEIKDDISCLKINYSLQDVIESFKNTKNNKHNSCPEKSYINNDNLIKNNSCPDMGNIDKYIQKKYNKNIDNTKINKKKDKMDDNIVFNDTESDEKSNTYIDIFSNLFKACDEKRF